MINYALIFYILQVPPHVFHPVSIYSIRSAVDSVSGLKSIGISFFLKQIIARAINADNIDQQKSPVF